MRRLLLTGAGGVIGRRVLQLLRESGGYEIFIATTDAKKYANICGVEAIEVDLLRARDRESLIARARPELLIHLAWDQRAPDFRLSAANYEWLAAGLELLTLFAKYGGWRALYAGSSSEYEARSGGMREDGGARAMSPYGLCKRSLTDAAIPCAEGFGASLAVARFFTIYGEDDAHDYGAIPSAIRSLSRGEPVVCRSPMAIRDYVYAGDAARAAVAILERDFRGTVNVASGRPRFVREVFTIVAEETGRPDLLTFDEKNTATDILAADVSRLNDELGITCGTELREGIRRCVSAITKRRRSV